MLSSTIKALSLIEIAKYLTCGFNNEWNTSSRSLWTASKNKQSAQSRRSTLSHRHEVQQGQRVSGDPRAFQVHIVAGLTPIENLCCDLALSGARQAGYSCLQALY